jgi:hypothetical protein
LLNHCPDSTPLTLSTGKAGGYEPADCGPGSGGRQIDGGDQLAWQDAPHPRFQES